MSDECFDDVAMTGMCGQHEGRLSVAIAGIRINTPPKKIMDDLDVTTLDRILPGANHQSKDSGSFVLSR
jgi:hypothetical protein